MKTMTLRKIDDDLAGELQRIAEQNDISMNTAVIHLLRAKVGLAKPRFHELHHDLDHLAGTWTKEDAEAFDEAVSGLSRTDEDMWE
jgi:hypothetical protein